MKDFSKIKFKGNFRHYQQNVLDNLKTHADNNKIHIVAAPGSGKTILGIEIIRRLNSPALILSPSVTIRNQWGDRIKEGFLDPNANVDDYVSYSLKEPKLFTSVTYQGLHAAFNRLLDDEEDEDELIEKKSVVNYSDFDLIKTLLNNKITTICLDEAHHLRNEWHDALTNLIQKLGTKLHIISLTATPPYDSSPAQWQKYMNLCGPIDDEIFVPELIAKKNLCPHQDYIYFNYPSSEEKQDLKEYKQRAGIKTKEILKSKYLAHIIKEFLKNFLDPKYNIFEDIEYYITLVNVAKSLKYHIPSKCKKLVKERPFLNKYDIEHLERLLEYIIDHPDRFGVENSSYIKNTLSEAKLIEKKKVNLEDNTMLKKALLSSIGKLRSIADIAKFESDQLQKKLRLLILTDYIRTNLIDIIGSNESNTIIGAVPIFEEVRRSVSNDVNIALLTGSLLIVPNAILDAMDLEATNMHTSYTKKKLPHVDYSIINFKSSNRTKVNIMTKLFEKGHIQIMIGTKALLGEGWDSPSINTLILASFVGSFMLSNQMRGRAIRVDKNDPNKVASIWHLATIEPKFLDVEPVLDKQQKRDSEIDEKTTIKSHDFDTLSRRFKSFLGPVYTKYSVESGIERIDIIEPPYGEKEFNKINNEMLKFAKDRDFVRKQWEKSVVKKKKFEILDVTQVPPKVWPVDIFIADFLKFFLITLVTTIVGIYTFPYLINYPLGKWMIGGVLFLYLIFFIKEFPKVYNNITPKRNVHSLGKVLLKMLREMDKIVSPKAYVVTTRSFRTRKINCSIAKGARIDKQVFAAAITEMMTQIDNPRYVIIKKKKFFKKESYNYWASYSVPKDIAAKKEYVESFALKLKLTKGNYAIVYTRSVEGRDELIKCKRKSRLSRHLINAKSNRIVKSDN